MYILYSLFWEKQKYLESSHLIGFNNKGIKIASCEVASLHPGNDDIDSSKRFFGINRLFLPGKTQHSGENEVSRCNYGIQPDVQHSFRGILFYDAINQSQFSLRWWFGTKCATQNCYLRTTFAQPPKGWVASSPFLYYTPQEHPHGHPKKPMIFQDMSSGPCSPSFQVPCCHFPGCKFVVYLILV